MDAVDQSIVQCLQQNPRASYSEIGRQISASESTVRRRLDSLLESGRVDIFVATRPRSFGESAHTLIWLDVELEHVEEVAAGLARHDHIIYVGIAGGTPAIWLSGLFQDAEELYQFVVHDLSKFEGVVGVTHQAVLRVLKRWPPWHVSE